MLGNEEGVGGLLQASSVRLLGEVASCLYRQSVGEMLTQIAWRAARLDGSTDGAGDLLLIRCDQRRCIWVHGLDPVTKGLPGGSIPA